MRGRDVEREIAFLHVVAVVPFVSGQAKQAFLEYRIAPVPESRRKTDTLMVIANSADPVLAPAIGAGTRLIVREILPGRAVGAVILANRAPLALAEIRSPTPPLHFDLPLVPECLVFPGRLTFGVSVA